MSDLPTLYYMHDGGDIDGIVRFVPIDEPLLTREEAANDREVILKVMRHTYAERQRLLGNEVTDE